MEGAENRRHSSNKYVGHGHGLGINSPRRPSDCVRAAVRGILLHDMDLTPRLIEILEMLSDGLDDEEIAGRLYVSARTVEDHVRYLREALRLRNRVQLVAYWLELVYQVTDAFRLFVPPLQETGKANI